MKRDKGEKGRAGRTEKEERRGESRKRKEGRQETQTVRQKSHIKRRHGCSRAQDQNIERNADYVIKPFQPPVLGLCCHD